MRTLLFDFDGTLADSFSVVVDIFYENTGHPRIEDPELIAYLRKQPIMVAAKELRVSPIQVPRLLVKGRKMMAERMDSVRLFDGMDEALQQLHAKGYDMQIMSSNSAHNINQFLEANGIASYFTKVYGGIGLLNKAAALKKVMRQNNLRPEQCIYIGDESRDIEGARKAGLPCVSVSWGYNDEILLRSRKPAALVSSAQELITAIEGI